MSELREHTCPKCGMYIWAHPIKQGEGNPVETDICSMSTGSAQAAYNAAVLENRRQCGNPQT